MFNHKGARIEEEVKYISCGCNANRFPEEKSPEQGNHKYPFHFFMTIDKDYEDFSIEIDSYFLNINKDNALKIVSRSGFGGSYDYDIYFAGIDVFKGFVYGVMAKHSLMPKIPEAIDDCYISGITPRALLFDAHQIMHSRVNKGLS